MVVANDESSDRGGRPKPSRDIVTSDYVRLLTSREGENRNPCGEDVSKCIHLRRTFSIALGGKTRKAAPTRAEMYARFSGSCLFTSFTHVQVMPAAVPPRAVRSGESNKSVCTIEQNDCVGSQ